MQWTRRDWMQLMAAAGAFGAVGGDVLFAGSKVRAQAAIPRRIVFLYVQSGSMPGRWEPKLRAGAAPSTETEWDVNDDLHGELAPYRADLNYFENLDFISEYDDPTDPANAHIQGGTHCMSAAHRASANQVGGITIDQFIAQGLGTVTPLPSIELTDEMSSHESSISALGAGASLPRIIDPRQAYDRLFPAGSTDPNAALRALRRRQIFDLVRRRGDRLAGRHAGIERERIEQHRDGVSDLARRLEIGGTRGVPPGPGILDPLDTANLQDPTERYRVGAEVHLRLVAAALHCDVTRVATVELPDAPDGECGYTPGQYGTTDTHGLIHEVMDSTKPNSQDPGAIEVIRRMHGAATHWTRFLLDELASRTEVDGQRLLDHTVVVAVSQIADGSHCLQRMPWYTVGSCGGALRTGRYFRAARRTGLNPIRWVSPRWDGAGRSHSDLFLTLAQAMGVNASSFGAPSACTGVIPGMLA